MFHVERKRGEMWFKLNFAEHKNRLYCDGFVDAIDSFYPSDPLRIVKKEKDGTLVVVRETKGRGPVHLNSGKR